MEEQRDDAEDDTTVVEPEQNNGRQISEVLRLFLIM